MKDNKSEKVKYSKEEVDVFLAAMGVNLLPYQRMIFDKLLELDEPVYINVVKSSAKKVFLDSLKAIVELNKEIEEERIN